jgi:UDP-glucose 4-epimerase
MGKRLGHVVVTGAAGFLGGHVIRELRQRRWEVTALDDLSQGSAPATAAADRFVRLDCRDRSALYALLSNKRTDAVVHLAGLHDATRARRDPEVVTEVNVGGVASLLGAMRPANVRHFVLGSSLDVYGRPALAVVTEQAPRAPTTPYGRIQAAVEAVVEDSGSAWALRHCTLRLAELGGPLAAPTPGGPRNRRLVARLLHAARRAHRAAPFVVEGTPRDGGSHEPRIVDLLHVADAARAVADALDAVVHHTAPTVANVSRGLGVALDVLVAEMRRIAERDFPATAGPLAPGEPAVLVASPARFSEATGWSPRESEPAAILRAAWESQSEPTADDDTG